MEYSMKWIMMVVAVLIFAIPPAVAQQQPDAEAEAEAPQQAEEDPDADADADADAETDAQSDEDEPGEDEPDEDEPDEDEPGEDEAGDDEQEEGEEISLAFRDMRIDRVAQFLSERLGKPVIPHDEIKDARITIVSNDQVLLEDAMLILREALRQQGVVIQENPRVIHLQPLSDVRRSRLRVVGEDESIAEMEDLSEVVDKVFAVEHYDAVNLKDAVVPMLSDFAHVTADPNTNKLVVTDTVGNLKRIEEVIAQLDVELADQTIKRIIRIEEGDAGEIVSIVRLIIGGGLGREGGVISTSAGAFGQGGGGRSGRGGGGRGGGGGGGVSEFAIEAADAPVVLVPEVSRNWIIAVAPARIMEQIEQWVEELDQPSDAEDEPAFEIYSVEHANPEQVAEQITEALDASPRNDIRENTRVVPFGTSGRLVVFGSRRGREFVKDLLDELDLENARGQEMRVFILEHADAEQIAESIETLFTSDTEVSYRGGYRSRFNTNQSNRETEIRAVADTIRNAVTVVTDTATMETIERMIREQWDRPLDTESVQPKVYELRHADPLQVRELLDNLFSQSQQSSGNVFGIFFGGSGSDQDTPVGPLFGQFGFQTMADSNRLVVTTKNRANYAVIDQLIEEIDQPQEAGLPRIIELKHANAEDLAEQLNASFAEPGTLAEIPRALRNLSDADRDTTVVPQEGGGGGQGQQEDQRDPGTMTFWWQQAQASLEERASSNLIGEIRFVPITRRNAMLIIAPSGYMEPIQEMVRDLDRPGMQVVIHAIIAEVEHTDETTLGIRFASDPSLLNDSRLLDQSVGGSVDADFNELFGGTYTVGDNTFGRGVLNAGVDLHALLQLLIHEFGLSILSEPKLYTADNQEAEFFDGRDVSIQTQAQTSAEGTSVTQSFTYVPIGTRLRVRPHITQQGNVDLLINLEMSDILTGEGAFGNPTFTRRETTTHIVVADGQTIMISGIVRQEDFQSVRKLPLLGDLPLVGGLFRSTETLEHNRELVAFITPYVVSTNPAEIDELMEPYREQLDELRRGIIEPEEDIEPVPLEEDEEDGEAGDEGGEREETEEASSEEDGA